MKKIFDIRACGKRIKLLREKKIVDGKRLTQERAAFDLNISIQFLRKIEHGERSPSIDLLVEIGQYFDVTMDYLILGSRASDVEIKQELQLVMTIIRSMIESLS